jgi:hypothetical protein
MVVGFTTTCAISAIVEGKIPLSEFKNMDGFLEAKGTEL